MRNARTKLISFWRNAREGRIDDAVVGCSCSAVASEDLVDPRATDARQSCDLALAEARVEGLGNEPRDRLVLLAPRLVEVAEAVAVLLELGSQRVRVGCHDRASPGRLGGQK